MRRILLSTLLIALIYLGSCQKCMQCSYTYTYIETVQTPNGEVVTDTTLTGYVLDDDGLTFSEECVKSNEDFTIEDAYKNFGINRHIHEYIWYCRDRGLPYEQIQEKLIARGVRISLTSIRRYDQMLEGWHNLPGKDVTLYYHIKKD